MTSSETGLAPTSTGTVSDIHLPDESSTTTSDQPPRQAPGDRPAPDGASAPESPVLALFGSPPAFADILHVGKPNMPDRARFMTRIEQVLDSGRLTNFGPQVLELEAALAQLAGTRHCVVTCNATVGLELAIAALGMHSEVIVPAFTFIASAHALRRQGIRPVFCDIDEQTHCLDPASVEAAITPQTTGILAVHLWGNPGATAELQALADRHGLALLYDAAHALGCASPEQPLGSYGDAAVYSLHATKVVHAFEGGAIVTDDDAVAGRLRLMTNFGFTGEDDVRHLGTNGKMSEASAAMGLTSLESLPQVIQHNFRLHQAYARGFSRIAGIDLIPRGATGSDNYHYIVAEVDETTCSLSRDELIAALRLENVVARRYFNPGCHRMAPYNELPADSLPDLPVTEAVARRVIVWPSGLAVSEQDVDRMVQRIATLLDHAQPVREALARCTDPRLPAFIRHPESSPRKADAS